MKHRNKRLSVLALVFSAGCVGLVVSSSCSKSNDLINVTFKAGIGKFNDGSRTRTLVVKKGTKLSEIPHSFASTMYFCAPIIDEEDSFADNDDFITRNFTTKLWRTSKEEIIDETVKFSDYVINDNMTFFANFDGDLSTAKSIAAGEIGNKITESIARQPEAETKLRNTANVAYEFIKNADDAFEALAIGTSTSLGIEAVARQPEAEGKIRNTLVEAYDFIDYSDDPSKSIAIGETVTSACKAVARQPEAEDKIRGFARTSYSIFLSIPSDGRVEGLSEFASAGVLAIAKLPEEKEKIVDVSNIIYDSVIIVDNPAKGQAIGHVGSAALTGVANQPEAETKIKKALKEALVVILNS